MLENLSDLISIIVILCFIVTGFAVLFTVSEKHPVQNRKKREKQFYDFLEEMDDRYDEEDDSFFSE